MKKTILAFMLSAAFMAAQQPEQIYPFARHNYPVSYLITQSGLWKKEVDQTPGNANAWYNYYYANRNLYFADTTEHGRIAQYARISELLDKMGQAIPETYEYNLSRWLHGGWDMKLIPFLRKAQQLGPDRPEHLDFSIVLAEIDNDIEARSKWSRKKHEAGQFSTGLMYYNYNVLSGLPENAILLTSGDNDTYPVWYLQSLGIRTDVTIVHTQLIHLKEYRDGVLGRLKIRSWTGDTPPWKEKDLTEKEANIVTWISGKTSRPLYVALTASSKTRSAPSENLYLTGLAYAYSTTPIDNIASLRRNFGQVYALDYLDKPFYNDISEDLVRIVNGNYIVPMLKVLEHYHASGDEFQARRIKSILLAISEGTTMEEEIRKKISVL